MDEDIRTPHAVPLHMPLSHPLQYVKILPIPCAQSPEDPLAFAMASAFKRGGIATLKYRRRVSMWQQMRPRGPAKNDHHPHRKRMTEKIQDRREPVACVTQQIAAASPRATSGRSAGRRRRTGPGWDQTALEIGGKVGVPR